MDKQELQKIDPGVILGKCKIKLQPESQFWTEIYMPTCFLIEFGQKMQAHKTTEVRRSLKSISISLHFSVLSNQLIGQLKLFLCLYLMAFPWGKDLYSVFIWGSLIKLFAQLAK